MKSKFVVISAVLILGLASCGAPPVQEQPPVPVQPQVQNINGTITEIALSAKTATLKAQEGSVLYIEARENTKIYKLDGSEGGFGDLRPYFQVSAVGAFVGANPIFVATQIMIKKEANISVYTPTQNQQVTSPLILTGVAREFESAFSYYLKDADGTVLAYGNATAQSPDAGIFGPFTISISYVPHSATGTLAVYANSAKDGTQIDTVTIPLKFLKKR